MTDKVLRHYVESFTYCVTDDYLARWRMGWNMKLAEREYNLKQNSWNRSEDGALPRTYIDVINRIVLRTNVNKV